MKSWLRYIGLGLLAYTLFMAATLPAALAYPYLKPHLAPLSLYGITGTVWSGEAQSAELGKYPLGILTWQAHPWMLLLGRVELAWTNVKGASRAAGTVLRRLDGVIEARAVTLNLPVAELAPLVPSLPLKPDGVLRASLAQLEFKDRRLLSAQGSLAWNGAALVAPQPLKLGDFVLNLSTADNAVRGNLADKGGPVQAQGILLIKPDGAYQFTGGLALRPTAQPQLQQILAFAGTPGADGKVAVSLSGVLPGSAPAIPAPPTPAQTAKAQ